MIEYTLDILKTIIKNEIDKDNRKFSLKLIKKLSLSEENIPIYINYDENKQIGNVVKFKYSKGNLIAILHLTKSINLQTYCFRYGLELLKEIKRKEVRIFTEGKLVMIGAILKNEDCYKHM